MLANPNIHYFCLGVAAVKIVITEDRLVGGTREFFMLGFPASRVIVSENIVYLGVYNLDVSGLNNFGGYCAR